MTDRSRAVRETRQEVLAKAATAAERELGDRRYDWVRSKMRRRLLVALWLVVTMAFGAVTVATGGNPFAVLAMLVPTAGVAYVLRRAVRGMADLPEELIDERMVAVRNRAYWLAYTVLGAVVTLGLVAAWIASDATRIEWRPGPAEFQAAMWTMLSLTVGLPSAVIAWSEPEV